MAVEIRAAAGLAGSEAGEAFLVPDGWGFPGSERGPALNDMLEQLNRYTKAGKACIQRIFEEDSAELLLSAMDVSDPWFSLQHREFSYHEIGHATGLGLKRKLSAGLLATPWYRAVEEWRSDKNYLLARSPMKAQSVLNVRQERTGWRDGHLSQRHRMWGLAVPAIDLDFLLLEYDRGRPTALIEYKAEHAAAQFPTHPSYLALCNLGDRAGIPVFAVRYAQDFSWWKIVPLNNQAKSMFPQRQRFTERQFVTFLYNVRGLIPPEEIFEGLELTI
jgi:hypothetical protein